MKTGRNGISAQKLFYYVRRKREGERKAFFFSPHQTGDKKWKKVFFPSVPPQFQCFSTQTLYLICIILESIETKSRKQVFFSFCTATIVAKKS